ncbi:hypothetical protein [uncultured Massilia sp.]|uniref:protein kinase domain-containing protein n=1 Tax=uncultured Massilia sp. TaxID=169973 RepID=UPI0025D0AFF1|nr:hypothetical protein [uncultured Massilia sp.]
MNAASKLTPAAIGKKFPMIAARYALHGDRPIGAPSGFGAVWKARDLWLERDVALKFSDRDMADELCLCRDIEGQTVRVFDYFRAADDWNAYAMELLEAPWMGVGRFIRAHRYRPDDLQHYFDCFEIARSLLSGLAQIHGRPYSRKQKFVHADIKPDNLFLMVKPKKRPDTVFRMPPAQRLVKIIDMGIGTAQGNPVLAYTPGYDSGERVARPGVDLYATAITFLELLTGERPDHHTMRHKARIRRFVDEMPSGAARIDALAVEFASNCASAYTRPGETVRVHARHLDEQVFGIGEQRLLALRAIHRHCPGGGRKDELADLLFGVLARPCGWRNRTTQRIDTLKEVVADLYGAGLLVLRGQRYFTA